MAQVPQITLQRMPYWCGNPAVEIIEGNIFYYSLETTQLYLEKLELQKQTPNQQFETLHSTSLDNCTSPFVEPLSLLNNSNNTLLSSQMLVFLAPEIPSHMSPAELIQFIVLQYQSNYKQAEISFFNHNNSIIPLDLVKVLHGPNPSSYPCLLFCYPNAALSLFRLVNGRQFNPLEAATCHLYLVVGLTASISTNRADDDNEQDISNQDKNDDDAIIGRKSSDKKKYRCLNNGQISIITENNTKDVNQTPDTYSLVAKAETEKKDSPPPKDHHDNEDVPELYDALIARILFYESWRFALMSSEDDSNTSDKNGDIKHSVPCGRCAIAEGQGLTCSCNQNNDDSANPLNILSTYHSGGPRLTHVYSMPETLFRNPHLARKRCGSLSWASSDSNRSLLLHDEENNKPCINEDDDCCRNADFCSSFTSSKSPSHSQSNHRSMKQEKIVHSKNDGVETRYDICSPSLKNSLKSPQLLLSSSSSNPNSAIITRTISPGKQAIVQSCEPTLKANGHSTQTQDQKEHYHIGLMPHPATLLKPSFLIERYEAPACCAVCLEKLLFASSSSLSSSSNIQPLPPDNNMRYNFCSTSKVISSTLTLEETMTLTDAPINLLCGHTFHSQCLLQWCDATCPCCRYQQYPSKTSCCDICGDSSNIMMCLICGFLGCAEKQQQQSHLASSLSRGLQSETQVTNEEGEVEDIMQQLGKAKFRGFDVNEDPHGIRVPDGHAFQHFLDSQHIYFLDITKQRVWDFAANSYVHRLLQNRTDGKVLRSDGHQHRHSTNDTTSMLCRHDISITAATTTHVNDILECESNSSTVIDDDEESTSRAEATLLVEFHTLLQSQLDSLKEYFETREFQLRQEFQFLFEQSEKEFQNAVEKQRSLNAQIEKLKADINLKKNKNNKWKEEKFQLEKQNIQLEELQCKLRSEVENLDNENLSRIKELEVSITEKKNSLAALTSELNDLRFHLKAHEEIKATNEVQDDTPLVVTERPQQRSRRREGRHSRR